MSPKKQITSRIINGETYQYDPATRGGININNPQDKISRRQFDKPLLEQQGFSSYEEKAKLRKIEGFTPQVRQHAYRQKQGNYYTYRSNDPNKIIGFIQGMSNNFMAYITAFGRFYGSAKTGHAGEIFHAWQSLTSFSRPSRLAKLDIIQLAETKFPEFGADNYEIHFTTFRTQG